MKTVYLVRHGDIEYKRNDQNEPLLYGPSIPLSPLGEKQASDLGKRLKDKKIEAIYTSPFFRTIQTSNLLNKQFKKPAVIFKVKDLRDVDTMGFVKNKITMKDFAKLTNGGDSYSHQIFKKQETLTDMLKRTIKAFKEIIKTTKYSHLAISSHGDWLSALVWMLDKKRPTSNYQEMKRYFYLEKGQAIKYEVDEPLKWVKRIGFITVEDVKKSIEYWRK